MTMNDIKHVSIKIATFVLMRLWWDNYLFDSYYCEHNCELPTKWVWRDNSQVYNNIAAKTISHLFSNVTCECLVMDNYMLKSQLPLSPPKSLVSRVLFTLKSFLIQPQSLSFTLYYDHGHPLGSYPNKCPTTDLWEYSELGNKTGWWQGTEWLVLNFLTDLGFAA